MWRDNGPGRPFRVESITDGRAAVVNTGGNNPGHRSSVDAAQLVDDGLHDYVLLVD